MRLLALVLVCASATLPAAEAVHGQSAEPPIPCVHDWSRAPIAKVTLASFPEYAEYLGVGGTRVRRDREPVFEDLAKIGRCKDATTIDWAVDLIASGQREIDDLKEWAQLFPESAATSNRLVGLIREALRWAEDERTNIRNERARRSATRSRDVSLKSSEPTKPSATPAPGVKSSPFVPSRTAAAARELKPPAVAKSTSEAKAVVDQLLSSVPDRAFAEWAGREVKIRRLSRSAGGVDYTLGITQEAVGRPVLAMYDRFFGRDNVEQLDLLTFEMAKGLWFSQINSGPVESMTQSRRDVEALIVQHQDVIYAMRFRLKDSDGLGAVPDNDSQSHFAYAARVAVLNIDPPAANPDPVYYSPEKWEKLKAQWPQARADFAELLTKLTKVTKK